MPSGLWYNILIAKTRRTPAKEIEMDTLHTMAESMAEHASYSRMEAWQFNNYGGNAWIEHCRDMERRYEEGREYPIGEMLECWQCPTATFDDPAMRECVALGSVINPADPTQSYKLECGHVTI